MTNILIATPTYNGSIDVVTYHSVFALADAIQKRGGRILIRTKVATLIDRARNLFASLVLNDPSITHLLFVDADMGFRPQAVLSMLDLNKPLVGALYPTRATPTKFVGADTILPGRKPKDGFIRVKHVGAGLMLIQRRVLEEMRDKYPELYLAEGEWTYREEGLDGPLLQAFAPMRNRRGMVMGEDTSFCQRWVDMDGQIYAAVDEEIAHVGRSVWRARYSDSVDLK